jgi:organic radical activating enzyme
MSKQLTVTPTNKIISIRPFKQNFQIHWLIGTRCNYSCSYCPPEWNSKTDKHLTYDQLITAWQKIIKSTEHIKQVTYDLCIMGGEPTLNKDLLPFLKWLKESFNDKVSNIGIITNGTANKQYYKELLQYCKWITFSTHSEFMNEKKFFDMLIYIHNESKRTDCHVHVNLMEEEWHLERNLEYENLFNHHNISYQKHKIIKATNNEHFPVKNINRINFNDYISDK